MALAQAIAAAKAYMKQNGIELEPGDTLVFQAPDGLLLLSMDEEESKLTLEAISGGKVIEITELLEIDGEPRGSETAETAEPLS